MDNTSRVDIGGITFFCIPKVAGSSIKKALLEWQGFSVSEFREVHNHPALKGDDGEQSGQRFAIIRHPYDRLVSAYADKTVNVTPRMRKQGYTEGMSFLGFCAHTKRIWSEGLLDHHVRPQTWFIGKNPIEKYPYCRLEESWDRIREKVSLSIPHLDKINPSKRGAWQNYFTDEILEMVEPIYSEDMILFNAIRPTLEG